MTQEMNAGERYRADRMGSTDDDRDREAIDGLDDDRITADRLAEHRAAIAGVAEDQDAAEGLTDDRGTDRGWNDEDRLDGDGLDGDRLDGDGERISPQSMLPHNQGEQATAGHGNGTPHGNGMPRDTVAQATVAQDTVADDDALFGRDAVDGLRARWIELQAAFVDEPRSAVQQADQLVAEVMQTMTSALSASKQQLEGQWQREGAADTEDLRQAMRQYRSFFNKLLNA